MNRWFSRKFRHRFIRWTTHMGVASALATLIRQFDVNHLSHSQMLSYFEIILKFVLILSILKTEPLEGFSRRSVNGYKCSPRRTACALERCTALLTQRHPVICVRIVWVSKRNRLTNGKSTITSSGWKVAANDCRWLAHSLAIAGRLIRSR